MGETQCLNRCGNLTIEGSAYCGTCKSIIEHELLEKYDIDRMNITNYQLALTLCKILDKLEDDKK